MKRFTKILSYLFLILLIQSCGDSGAEEKLLEYEQQIQLEAEQRERVAKMQAELKESMDSGESVWVHNGDPALPSDAPFQVSLFAAGEQPADRHDCGGSIIDSVWVVTAAHCFFENYCWTRFESDLEVLYGTTRLDSAGTIVGIDTILVHPGYNPCNKEQDIALIRLDSPLPLSDTTWKSINLPDSSAVERMIANSDMLTVTGWGRTEKINRPVQLQKAKVPLVSYQQCRNSYGDSVITGNMICAGYSQGGKDACQGDSGGPLFTKIGGKPTLIGVVSWGRGCALPGYYGVYTDVRDYVSWIEENIKAVENAKKQIP